MTFRKGLAMAEGRPELRKDTEEVAPTKPQFPVNFLRCSWSSGMPVITAPASGIGPAHCRCSVNGARESFFTTPFRLVAGDTAREKPSPFVRAEDLGSEVAEIGPGPGVKLTG